MLCQSCNSNPATVSVVTPQQEFHKDVATGHENYSFNATTERLCDECAKERKLNAPMPKSFDAALKLLQAVAQPKSRPKRDSNVTACPDCGMTLREFRQRQRLGCAKDYEVFGSQLAEILERIHGAKAHVGRVPGGGDDESQQRMQRILELRARLDEAIRDEAYEAAARLRDELKTLTT